MEKIHTVKFHEKWKEALQAVLPIMDHAGLNSEAKAIAFSLPVTATAGLRLLEEEKEEA